MPRSLRTTSFWDSIPSETVLDICSFLPTIDLLNLCAAYHDIEQLAINTSILWWSVHLPYPDPQLHNYPGWRRRPPTASTASTAQRSTYQHSAPTPRQSGQSSQPSSSIPVLQDARYRFMTTDYDSDLYGLDTSENSSAQPEFIAWIILDVLDSIPLHFTRHLSFDSPPCHLCDYPCKRFCACECHQNEQTHRQQDSAYQFQRHLNTWHPPQQDQVAPLSQPLQNLFESGLVDFSRHIDVRSLNQALTMDTAAMTEAIPLAGIGHLSYVSQSDINTNIVQEELSLEDALQQLSSIEDVQGAESQHITSRPPSSETFVQTYGTYVAGEEGIRTAQETEHQLTEEEQLEESRQQYETRAAYLRARLLMQILSFRDLGSLEILRAPWWPATRIYTIRQQLERWSFMVEQAVATNRGDEATMGQESPLRPESAEALRQGSVPAPRTHWTNKRLSDIDTNTTLAPRMPSTNPNSSSEQSAAERQPTILEATSIITAPSFPLASLTRFTLRYGGEVSSHDRHCLGMSAMILSGRSSADSSQSATPPSQATDPRMPIPTDSAPPTLTVLHWPCKRVFRYCHHCGSQYLQAPTTTTLRRTCFCERPTPLPST